MSTTIEYENRQIIPRWLSYDKTKNLPAFSDYKEQSTPRLADPVSYKTSQFEWELYREVPYAVEFICAAILAREYENASARAAAEYLLSHQKTSFNAKELASRYIDLNNEGTGPTENDLLRLDSPSEIHGKIAVLKNSVQSYGYNPIAWVDLALNYTLLGQDKKALKCINIALSMAKDSRYILRSGARLFVHLDMPEDALAHIRKSIKSKCDPWLISTEIAISESFDITSKRLKEAKYLTKLNSHQDFELAELYGTLGTLEFKNGAVKNAKKMITKSLIGLNENCLAQAEWLSKETGKNFSTNANAKAQYEAQLIRNYAKQDFSAAVQSSEEWLCFQPFSSMPAVMGSYLATVALKNYSKSIELCKVGLIASPSDYTLKNNLACSLVLSGKLVEAREVVENLKQSSDAPDHSKLTFIATEGLLEFEEGNSFRGRELYNTAVEGLLEKNLLRAAAVALTFWSEKESIFDKDFSQKIEKKRDEILALSPLPELKERTKHSSLIESATSIIQNLRFSK